MSVLELLKVLRIRDKQIAETMGIKIAQLNRWQKGIQKPTQDSLIKIKTYVEDIMRKLQLFLNENEE